MIIVQNKQPREGELTFDFRKALQVWDVDESGNHSMSRCMKAVDFLVEWDEEVWMVEVKNPAQECIPLRHRKRSLEEFMKKILSKKIFSQELGPKGKDTFLFLYLSKQLTQKPLKYLALIEIPDLEPALLTRMTDNLATSVCSLGPNARPWKLPYIQDAGVFNIEHWNRTFSTCQITKLPPLKG